MSQNFKHTAATLAAITCFAFAATVSAAEPADNPQNAVANSNGVCHPAYLPCRKEAPKPLMVSSVQEHAVYLLRGEFEFMPVGSTCHPAYRPCPGWSYWERNYPVASRAN